MEGISLVGLIISYLQEIKNGGKIFARLIQPQSLAKIL